VLAGTDLVQLNLGRRIEAGCGSARAAAALMVGWWRRTARLSTAARLGSSSGGEAARWAALGGGLPANSSEFTVSVLRCSSRVAAGW
jgi:hypothetical protein